MQHLIFEGAELAGKSWLMSRIYNYLEPKYNQSGFVLDGCHWFNADVGVFGTVYGEAVINNYINLFTELRKKNLLVEKFHTSDIVYNKLHRNTDVSYQTQEKILKDLDFKIILVAFPEDEAILQKRIQDRLNLYPHYQRILQKPAWYIAQQKAYKKELEKSILPVLTIKTDQLPNEEPIEEILKWIKE